LHVRAKPGGGSRPSWLLLIKLAHTGDEIGACLFRNGQSIWAEVRAQKVEAFDDAPDKRLVWVLRQP